MQGFPALELLLYGEGAAAKLQGPGADADYRCAMIKAITDNLQTMARELRDEWTGGDDPYAKLVDRADDVRFRRPSDVTIELFKSLYTAIELVADHKLARPLGASPQAARPRLAESWRSKRSLANIRRNLAAAEAMYEGEHGGSAISAFVSSVAGDAALDALLRRAFAQTLATANGISGAAGRRRRGSPAPARVRQAGPRGQGAEDPAGAAPGAGAQRAGRLQFTGRGLTCCRAARC